MAIKGPYISRKKGAKKGSKKKQVDTFAKKEWFDLRIPPCFTTHFVGKTLVTRTSNKQNVEKLLLGRCFEVNQGDTGDNKNTFRKFKFVVEDVRGKDAISNFHGMSLTSDKYRGIVRKGHRLIEAEHVVKTLDGYVLRVFVVAQSRREKSSLKTRVHIQTARVKEIRQLMFEIIEDEFAECTINDAMQRMCDDTVGREIEQRCSVIAPLQNCFTKQVLVVKRPKYERKDDDYDFSYADGPGHYNPDVVTLEQNDEYGNNFNNDYRDQEENSDNLN